MRAAVTAGAAGLGARSSPVFGRCPMYTFVDTDTMQFQTMEDPAMSASRGAGIRAAMFVLGNGAQAVLSEASVPMHLMSFRPSACPCISSKGMRFEAWLRLPAADSLGR
jgi:predicted Fe-Mo cluster-binding NifX family protein